MGCGPKGRRFESCQAYPDRPPGLSPGGFVFALYSTPRKRRVTRFGDVGGVAPDPRSRDAALLYSPVGEVSEWLKVPLSKSGVVMSHRGFESHPLRRTSF